jgi:ubiquinone/menaquinone biosynthesis C-methylase UbiE
MKLFTRKHFSFKFLKIFILNLMKKNVIYPLRIQDIIDWISIRRKNNLIPPTRLLWGGTKLTSSTFYKWGMGDLDLFIKHCGVSPNSKVLDVGCGIGRCGIAFSGFLDGGSYDGFDSNRSAIDMCENISSLYPFVNFKYADVYNEFYNQNGSIEPSEFIFPYQDESFDFIFLISVFTHMLPKEMDNYLKEISRVLKKGGKCFITYFILNDKSRSLIALDKSAFNFKYRFGECYLETETRPGHAVAYTEDFLQNKYFQHSFNILQTQYGSWSGASDYSRISAGKKDVAHKFTTLQDIVIASKNR